MLGLRLKLMTINGSVMKMRIECATAQKAAVPLNKNESRLSRNDFVMLRDTAF